MIKLKNYQINALDVLKDFLFSSQSMTYQEAFNRSLERQDRFNEPFNQIFRSAPSVCLRVPTGGGKTLLAAYSIDIAAKSMLTSESPVVLWLTPSDVIRSQTVEALSDPSHPYRQAIAKSYGDRVRVADLESLQTINPQDVGSTCIIVVATIQSFNVTNTAKRNVYSFFEELAPHFSGLKKNQTDLLEKVTNEDLEVQKYLTDKDLGRVKYSVANWLNLQNPIIIVDEAHNNRTDTFFTTLDRLNPSCVIELTATPVRGNNVLYHVSAQELKAEQMIKLPIVLAEHPTGWKDCLRDAILTRKKLATLAENEAEYIRPIVLIQAAPRGNEAVVEVVKDYLINDEHIPEEDIAVATGSERGLENINLFDKDCPIKYVITVEALKEGWDCSFAYVLASLQSVNSSKDVEQLLGRVLRMPYAKNRSQEPLNKAYAHIVAENFAEAAAGLKDRMVQNMGFERLELASVFLPSESQGSGGDGSKQITKAPECLIQVSAAPDTKNWPEQIKQLVEVRTNSQGAVLVVNYQNSEELKQAQLFVTESVKARDKESVKNQFDDHHAIRQAIKSPALLGYEFSPIPQLCIELDGSLDLVEQETLSSLGSWNLSSSAPQLAGFNLNEDTKEFEIDISGQRVTWKMSTNHQIDFNSLESDVTENDLIRWLDQQVMDRYWGITQNDLQAYLKKLITHLIVDRGFTKTSLVRGKNPLSTAIRQEINRLRNLAIEKGFQSSLPKMQIANQDEINFFSFQYKSGEYAARSLYRGSYEFQKHYYPVIHDLKEKTASGRTAEEFTCALMLDSNPSVKYWVRNIERQSKQSFWLPTSTDYFYPDFVAELIDGRILAIEYKGDPYVTNDDSREKISVGEQWEKASNGKCLFLFAVAHDDKGRSVEKQIQDKLI